MTVNGTALDVPPPGGPFVTCTGSWPGAVFAGTTNVSVELSPKLADIGALFKATCEAGIKPEPLMVTVAPGKADAGVSDEIAGAGFVI